MSELHDKQVLFARLLPRLIDHAFSEGYEVVVGEVWRPPETAAAYAAAGKGIKNSLHLQKLAVDLILFHGGAFLMDSEQYGFLGAYWKSLDPACRWGGDFVHLKDGNHFSIAWEGRA